MITEGPSWMSADPIASTTSSSPAASRPIIDISHVSFSYYAGGSAASSPYGPLEEATSLNELSPVISDLNFTALPGSITLLCGASGSGKSSVLRLLNGLIPNFHSGSLDGKVEVAEVQISETDLTESGRVSSTVFQNPRTQFFTTDVRSELAFRGQNYGLDPAVIATRTAQSLADIGISHLIDRPLMGLSGGELQKVACAQALSAQTPVILFAEPTSNLSPSAIDDFAAVVGKLKQRGATIAIAEHRLYFLRGLVDTVLLIRDGSIQQSWDGESFFAMTEDQRLTLGLRTLSRPMPPER